MPTPDLSKSIESVYGADAGKAFLDLWRKHVGFLVDYTTGKATNDMAKVEKARADLDGYRADFGAFIAQPPQAGRGGRTDAMCVFAAIDAAWAARDDPTVRGSLPFICHTDNGAP